MIEAKKPENPKKEIRNVIYKSNATITYNLEKRWHVIDIYVPTYKCQGGGTVVIQFFVDPNGLVLNPAIEEPASTNDACLRNEALNSIRLARFNADPQALPKQQGTITYVFFPQN